MSHRRNLRNKPMITYILYQRYVLQTHAIYYVCAQRIRAVCGWLECYLLPYFLMAPLCAAARFLARFFVPTKTRNSWNFFNVYLAAARRATLRTKRRVCWDWTVYDDQVRLQRLAISLTQSKALQEHQRLQQCD